MLNRNKNVLGVLVGFLGLLMVSLPSNANILPAGHVGSKANVEVAQEKISVSWTIRSQDDNEFRITGTCYQKRDNIWTYQFPGYDKAKVDGLVLLMADPKVNLLGVDLEEHHNGIRLVYDTERAIEGTVDMSQVIGEAYLWERIPTEAQFVWVAYKSNHNGTFVTAVTPAMNPEQLLKSLANESEKGEGAIAVCDNSSGLNKYVKQ